MKMANVACYLKPDLRCVWKVWESRVLCKHVCCGEDDAQILKMLQDRTRDLEYGKESCRATSQRQNRQINKTAKLIYKDSHLDFRLH